MSPREILEQYKSAPISIKTVEDDKIVIVYSIDLALSQIANMVKCRKIDNAEDYEQLAWNEAIDSVIELFK